MPKRLELSPHASSEELEHTATGRPKIPWNALIGRSRMAARRGQDHRGGVRGQRLQPRGWVRRIAHRYNERGIEGLGDRRHANPDGARERALLEEEGQAELRQALCGPPPPGGGMCGAGRRWRALDSGEERFGEGACPAGLRVPEEGGYEPPGSQALECPGGRWLRAGGFFEKASR